MAEHSQFQLLRERRFAPFFWTQFLGAGNDNVYKNALVIFVAFQAAGLSALSSKPGSRVQARMRGQELSGYRASDCAFTHFRVVLSTISITALKGILNIPRKLLFTAGSICVSRPNTVSFACSSLNVPNIRSQMLKTSP